IAQVFKRGKSLAAGKTRLREELSRQIRIKAEAIRRRITGNPRRCVAGGSAFAAFGDLFNDAPFVDDPRQRLAHAGVAERFARHVEADEISAQIGEAVEVVS